MSKNRDMEPSLDYFELRRRHEEYKNSQRKAKAKPAADAQPAADVQPTADVQPLEDTQPVAADVEIAADAQPAVEAIDPGCNPLNNQVEGPAQGLAGVAEEEAAEDPAEEEEA